MKELSQALKDEAHRLGFALVGVTTPAPPPHMDIYESWLAAGRHGEMAYLANETARQRRADPLLILPECRSILALGIRYSASTSQASAAPLHGQVASYAWGDDYHQVLAERLQALGAWIEAQAGHPVPYRWYTDTGPLLERDLAQRAGLGWIGKNTCLIHPNLGSYIFLAEMLLGIELPPDSPFIYDRCGACTRCLQACPTSCILPDRTLDARRCLSYLTIELKGLIPPDLRPSLGNWVFGCDICQQVCPWNVRFASPHGDQAFMPRRGATHPNLLQELTLNTEAFNRHNKGRPLQRAKRRGYLRNVSVALGNSSNPAAIPALIEALEKEPEPLVRGHAAWALGNLSVKNARRALEEALPRETEPYVRGEIEQALSRVQGLRKS